ncbi:acyltransferase [Gelidibacter salicanalis]|uniref:Acyltransferase n=1 Tax=Gelidibacter salicanalis TaxID=291193 RepID=A0A934NH27_9FLAO|nr:acyltransferase [Gelidibacter salicanalis]MBJ7879163.1 acyltransferase [Gelidibacter salicanalis]
MTITKEKIIHVIRNPFRIFIWIVTRLPYFDFLKATENGIEKINFNMWYNQKVLGNNKNAYWPVHKSSRIVGEQNIYIGLGTFPGFQRNIYIQGTGKLYFGNYTIVGQNSGVLSGNHDLYDYRKLAPRDTKIGSYCWIGMNSTVLGGVVLGDHTIVSAGSVVTKSFPEGFCVIGGVPAKIIKKIDPNEVVKYEYEIKYHGYIRQEKFEGFRRKNLNI